MTRRLFLLPVLVSLAGALHAQTGTVTAYYDFLSTSSTVNSGANPNSPPVEGPDGLFYGTLQNGGTAVYPSCDDGIGCGAIFKTAISGTPTILHTFDGTDGFAPLAGMILGSDGNFYGTTGYGGPSSIPQCGDSGCGTIFKITPAGAFTMLHGFVLTDGGVPQSSLVQATDGNLYGTTYLGGSDLSLCTTGAGELGCGVIFEYNLSTQTFSVAYTFQGQTDEGGPWGPLLQGSDGNLYGTTIGLGPSVTTMSCPSGCGTIFSFDLTTKKLTTLYSFSGADGYYPLAGLVEGASGNYFGSTSYGGTNGYGTIFAYSTATKTLTTIHSLGGTTSDGEFPAATMFLAGDGQAYGHAEYAESAVFYTVSEDDIYSDLSITGSTRSITTAGLVQESNGLFYGTGQEGAETEDDCDDKDVCGFLYTLAVSTNPPPAINLTLSSPATEIGQPVTLTWSVNNAYSTTLQQCYAYTATGGGTGWSGQINFTPTNGAATGTATVTPTAGGVINYAFICGGSETAIASLTVGATTTALTAIPSSAAGETPIALAATVTSALGTPTGTVSFYLGATLLGSSTLTAGSSGTATANFTLNTDALYQGDYTVSANYSGSSTLAPSASPAVTIDITSSRNQASILIGSSGLTVSQGSSLTLSANVTPVESSLLPTGTVTFSSGSATLGTVTLNSSGVGSMTVRDVQVPIGPYPVIGSYSGDTNFLPSVSAVLQIVIKYGTHCPFTAAATGASTVALTSTVTSAGDVTPTGTVTWSVGSTTLGSATLNSSGVATYTASSAGIAAGSYSVTATYNGDPSNNVSSASSVVQLLAPTTITASASPSSVTPPGNVTLTATVKRSSGTVNSGTVTFYVGTLEIGSGTVTNGTASFTASSNGIAAGSYPVTAKYGGDALDAASTAPNITVVVQ